MKLYLSKLFIFSMIVSNLNAQNNQFWNGKKCAVVLTYDDGLNVHLDNAIPLLDSFGLKGTFYIPGNSVVLATRMDEWRKAAANGHELGNHTLFHPCNGRLPGREWVGKDHDLADYSLQQIVDEVRVCNTLLKAVDGKTTRTFAYTCGDMEVNGVLFYDQLKDEFAAARGVYSALNNFDNVDVTNINSFMINGQSGDELINLVKDAKKSGTLIVFLFHGVGGEHSLNVSLPAHRELLQYLNKNRDEIWTATMVDVAEHVSELKKSN